MSFEKGYIFKKDSVQAETLFKRFQRNKMKCDKRKPNGPH